MWDCGIGDVDAVLLTGRTGVPHQEAGLGTTHCGAV